MWTPLRPTIRKRDALAAELTDGVDRLCPSAPDAGQLHDDHGVAGAKPVLERAPSCAGRAGGRTR